MPRDAQFWRIVDDLSRRVAGVSLDVLDTQLRRDQPGLTAEEVSDAVSQALIRSALRGEYPQISQEFAFGAVQRELGDPLEGRTAIVDTLVRWETGTRKPDGTMEAELRTVRTTLLPGQSLADLRADVDAVIASWERDTLPAGTDVDIVQLFWRVYY